MKVTKYMIALLLISLCLFLNSSCVVLALDFGLDVESLPDEEIEEIAERRNFVKFTSDTLLPVKCFDVRDDHMIVIGATSRNDAVIAVYNADGNFQYGFKTKEPGSFRVMWNGDSIAFYSIRAERLYTVNEYGKITDIQHVVSSMENSIYDREVLSATTRTIGDYTYHMSNDRTFADGFSTTFKKITRTDVKGTIVVYDASGQKRVHTISRLIIFVIMVLFIAICIVVGINKQLKKLARKTDDDSRNTEDGSLC